MSHQSIVRAVSSDRNVEANWRWIVVLEIVQIQVAHRAELVRNPNAVIATSSGNHVFGTRFERVRTSEIFFDSRLVVVGCLIICCLLEPLDLKPTVGCQGKRRGLQVALFREEEDEAAGLVFEAGGKVEVENGGNGGGDGAIVARACGNVGRILRDRYNQVRILEVRTQTALR